MKKLFAFALLPLVAACTQIDTGNVGVESTLGQYKADELPPGVYWTVLKTVHELSIKENSMSLQDMKPKSKDNLTMADLDLDIYFRIDPSKAADLMIKYAGDLTKPEKGDGLLVGVNLLTRQAREAAYRSAAEFMAAEMHTKRTEIAAGVMNTMQAELDKDAGKGAFVITNVIVRNIVTDAALEAAIKSAGQADFEIARKKKEVELAKAEADRKRVEAQGEADAIKIKADAISRQGGKEYVELKAIEKWDGKLPTTTGGVVPFVNVSTK